MIPGGATHPAAVHASLAAEDGGVVVIIAVTLPVMVLTTRGDEASRETVLEAGATSYLTKPFSPSLLAASVRELLDAVPDQR